MLAVWISPIVQNIEVPPGAHEPYHGKLRRFCLFAADPID